MIQITDRIHELKNFVIAFINNIRGVALGRCMQSSSAILFHVGLINPYQYKTCSSLCNITEFPHISNFLNPGLCTLGDMEDYKSLGAHIW